jgi:hypothetical protein
MLGATLFMVVGCNDQSSWDKEYSCSGQERSSTFVQGRPNYEKDYPIDVDFHIRSDMALVKSYQVRLNSGANNQVNFSSKTGAFWVSGSFEPKTGALEIVEGRSIAVDGAPQETRISGRYRCVASGTATS